MRNIFIAAIVLFIAGACSNKELTNEEKIAGTAEKTWEATRETDASGDKINLRGPKKMNE